MTPSDEERKTLTISFSNEAMKLKEKFVLWILICNSIDYIWGWGCKTPDDFMKGFNSSKWLIDEVSILDGQSKLYDVQ